MDKITDYQAAAADADNDTIDLVTEQGANSASIDVKSAIAGGGGSETVTATVTNGVVTLSGSMRVLSILFRMDRCCVSRWRYKKAADDAMPLV